MLYKNPNDRISANEILSSNIIPGKTDEESLKDALKIIKLNKSHNNYKEFLK